MSGGEDEILEPPRRRGPNRFLTLLLAATAAGLLAEPHGDYSRTALGLLSPVVLAFAPALLVAFIIWLIIRRLDASAFGFVSLPVAFAVMAMGAIFLRLKWAFLSRAGLPDGEAIPEVLASSTGLTLALGVALAGAALWRRNKETNRARD